MKWFKKKGPDKAAPRDFRKAWADLIRHEKAHSHPPPTISSKLEDGSMWVLVPCSYSGCRERISECLFLTTYGVSIYTFACPKHITETRRALIES